MNLTGTECARARESVSADLDRELQELEARRLQAHLRVCMDCADWAGRVRATTAQLREAPFEPTLVPVFEMPHRVSARRVGVALVAAPAAALAASLVFSVGLVQHGLLGNPRTGALFIPTERNLVQNSARVDLDRLTAQHRVFRAI